MRAFVSSCQSCKAARALGWERCLWALVGVGCELLRRRCPATLRLTAGNRHVLPLSVVCYIGCIIIASSTSSGNISVSFLLRRREWLGWPEARDQVHPRKSYIFLHKNSVTFENIEWRPLFPPDRLKADEVMWRCGLPRLSDEATQNLRSRREWRGCLIVDVKMATGRFRDGVVVSGSAASPAGQT